MATPYTALLRLFRRPGPVHNALRLAAIPLFAGGAMMLTGLICRGALPAGTADWPYLIAPMGGTCALLFVVPASPFARPWPVVGGNVLSALAGYACTQLASDPVLAGGMAVGAAILVMGLARCLHPPGAAVALLTVIGSPAVKLAGWHLAFFPVAANALLLLAMARVCHRLLHAAAQSPVLHPESARGASTTP